MLIGREGLHHVNPIAIQTYMGTAWKGGIDPLTIEDLFPEYDD